MSRMEHHKWLEELSGKFFLAGLLLNKISGFRLPFITPLLFILSALSYLAGYAAWHFSIRIIDKLKCNVKSEYKIQFEKEFKHMANNAYSILFGILACISLLASLIYPLPMSMLSSILFFTSNFFWWYAESQSLNYLQQTQPQSPITTTKSEYYKYVSLATLSSALTAISMCLCFVFPTLITPLAIGLTSHLVALNLMAFKYWFDGFTVNQTLQSIEPYSTGSYDLMFETKPCLKPSINQEKVLSDKQLNIPSKQEIKQSSKMIIVLEDKVEEITTLSHP